MSTVKRSIEHLQGPDVQLDAVDCRRLTDGQPDGDVVDAGTEFFRTSNTTIAALDVLGGHKDRRQSGVSGRIFGTYEDVFASTLSKMTLRTVI